MIKSKNLLPISNDCVIQLKNNPPNLEDYFSNSKKLPNIVPNSSIMPDARSTFSLGKLASLTDHDLKRELDS